jgi:endo-1,4-beta-mannosidase
MKHFARLAADIEFDRLERPDTDAVLIVSSYMEAEYPFTEPEDASIVYETSRQAYIAAREADIPIGVARELDGLPGAALYILPSAKQLTAPTWRELRRRAAAGATVYASVFYGEHATQRGPWWPDIDETFGVVKQTRYGLVDPVVDDHVEVTFIAPFGRIEQGERLVFPVGGTVNSRAYLPVAAADAEVLAADQHGNPALLRKREGAGWMVLATFPFEYFATVTPFVNPEPTWRIYDALAEEADVRRTVRVDDPRVLAAELVRDDGRRFVWLVSEADEAITVTPATHGRLLDLTAVEQPSVSLEPYGVEILERVE